MDERRRHQRFQLNNSCIINHSRSVGTIIDISMGGLSCTCLDQGECSKGLSARIDIYCRKQDIRAEDISMRVLSTEKITGKFIKNLGLRKCRAKFIQLDDSQQGQLSNIIVNSS